MCMQYLLFARQCSKCFICINSFNTHSNPMRYTLVLSSFCIWGNWSILRLNDFPRSCSKWQGWELNPCSVAPGFVFTFITVLTFTHYLDVLSTVPSASFILASFNLHNGPEISVLLRYSFYKWKTWGTERLSNLPQVITLWSGGAMISIKATWYQTLGF